MQPIGTLLHTCEYEVAIKEIRGIKPMVLRNLNQPIINEDDMNGLLKLSKDWLTLPNNQDLLVDRMYLNGFEWPSIIWIEPKCPVLINGRDRNMTNMADRNILMRTTSTFVEVIWMQDNALATPKPRQPDKIMPDGARQKIAGFYLVSLTKNWKEN